MDFTDIKVPDPVGGVPPWQDPRWVAEADAWIAAQWARAGLARTGPAQARCRPYSVVARVPVSGGTVWFKASPPPARFEPALLVALARWYPDQYWGDATVGHPFCSLSVASRTAAQWAGVAPGPPELAALTEIYLGPWLEAGYPRAAADRSVSLAPRIAPATRAMAWGRVFPCCAGHPAPAGNAVRALDNMLTPGLPGYENV